MLSPSAGSGSDRAGIWQPLAKPDFRFFWAAQALSLLGDSFSYLAIAWLALQFSGSPLVLGSVLFVQGVPMVLLVLVGGAISDRVSARTVMVASAAARALAMGAAAALVLSGRGALWELYALGLAIGIAGAFYLPARSAAVAVVVLPEQLEQSYALLSLSYQFAAAGGPALAGLLVARGGGGVALAVDGACYLAAAFAAAFITRPARTARAESRPGLAASIAAGLRYVYADPVLRVMFMVTAALNLAYSGPYRIGLATLARTRFPEGAAALGLMLGAYGAGALAGVLVAGRWRGTGGIGRRVIVLVSVMGVGLGALAFVPTLAMAAAVTALMGLCSGFVNVFTPAWIQRRTESQMQGRVQGLFSLATLGMAPISVGVAGLLAQVDLRVMFLAGTAMVLASTAAAALNRSFRSI